jgi:drug/metabolite transporter (DMT)-like permease
MLLLTITSLIWAFSFGLIKHKLGLDANLSAFIRLLLSFLVFAPFLRRITIPRGMRMSLFLIGAVQHGLMYALYMNSFRFLPAHLVAVFTIFTPIFVTFINDWNERAWHPRHFGAALLAVVGTGVIVAQQGLQSATVLGFILLQASNFCFAYGQIRYREIMRAHPEMKDHEVFGMVYAGAAAAAAIPGLIATAVAIRSGSTASVIPTAQDLWVQLYLGIIPSGLCFFLWNAGARRAHPAVLAVMNNLKIPLAVAVALVVFSESANLPRLLIGGGMMLIAVAWSRRIAVRAGA